MTSPSLFWTPLQSQVRSPHTSGQFGLPPRSFITNGARSTLDIKPLSGPPNNVPPTPNQNYLTHGVFYLDHSSGCLLHWSLVPSSCSRAFSHGPPLPCVGHQAWTPLSLHHWCKNGLWLLEHCCATVALDNSATMTYNVAWKHSWNISLPQWL